MIHHCLNRFRSKWIWLKIDPGYEFEADGVSMSWETSLHKGYDITKQHLGLVRQKHREITAWCHRFGAENSYSATGNGLFGGKNCQDVMGSAFLLGLNW